MNNPDRKGPLRVALLLLAALFLSNAKSPAQSSPGAGTNNRWTDHLIFQGAYQNGYVFNTNTFTNGTNAESSKITAFQTFSLKLSSQTVGNKDWEQLFLYPDWGFGLYLADFHNPEEIGTPIAAYGFLHGPFVRGNHLAFNYELSFGATFNWKSYNPLTNQYNIAIGAGQSFFIDAGLNLTWPMARHIDLEGGFSLTHFSNGALKRPNNGLNTIAPKLALKYNFFDPPEFKHSEKPAFSGKNEFLLIAFGGMKNLIFDSVNLDVMEKYEGVFFPVFGLSGTFDRQISRMSKIGIGMGISYDGSVNAQLAVENNELEAEQGPVTDKIRLSIFPSYELVVNRVSLILQPAFYLYRKKLKNQSPAFHQRIGLRYRINDHLFAGISLRDYAFHVSDFIEWNIGYVIK